MTNLTQSELNSIREVVTGHQTMACKLSNFAGQVQDPNIKQMFTKAAQDARTAAQNLVEML